jgi:hypothetical protein
MSTFFHPIFKLTSEAVPTCSSSITHSRPTYSHGTSIAWRLTAVRIGASFISMARSRSVAIPRASPLPMSCTWFPCSEEVMEQVPISSVPSEMPRSTMPSCPNLKFNWRCKRTLSPSPALRALALALAPSLRALALAIAPALAPALRALALAPPAPRVLLFLVL